MHIYNSNVKSVLLYGSECWRIIESNIKKVEVFHNNCLRKINRIFWHSKISNKDLLKKSKCKNIVGEIKQRRMRWLWHVMRMAPSRIPKLPYTGHHLAREKQADQEHGGGQLHQSWRKWVFLWAKLSTLQRTGGDGDTLLMPYVP
jgi:hypothetical protein